MNIICPPRCPICQREVDAAHCLCPECFAHLNFITKPCCEICGRPFEYRPYGRAICAQCFQKQPLYHMARSILKYDSFSKKLVLAFKHADRTEISFLFCKFLSQVDPDLFEVDMVISVPLHPLRLMHRKYNQSSLLAKEISQKFNIPFGINILKRSRATSSQGHLSQQQRRKNIKNAFLVEKKKKILGKKILLVDDVLTTGATINECTKELLKAGVKHVNVLTVYRVFHD